MIYRFHSPLGPIYYDWDGNLCRHIWLQRHEYIRHEQDDTVSRWLSRWFDGLATPLPPIIAPASSFQAIMRPALLAIPVGETRSYGEMARELGTSARAMGQALGANPLPVIIPCHRVIAADGPGGFASGLRWKQKLLDFEAGLSQTGSAIA